MPDVTQGPASTCRGLVISCPSKLPAVAIVSMPGLLDGHCWHRRFLVVGARFPRACLGFQVRYQSLRGVLWSPLLCGYSLSPSFIFFLSLELLLCLKSVLKYTCYSSCQPIKAAWAWLLFQSISSLFSWSVKWKHNYSSGTFYIRCNLRKRLTEHRGLIRKQLGFGGERGEGELPAGRTHSWMMGWGSQGCECLMQFGGSGISQRELMTLFSALIP